MYKSKFFVSGQWFMGDFFLFDSTYAAETVFHRAQMSNDSI
jgi:hypothetical protein